MADSLPCLLTVEEVAQILRVGRTTIYNMFRRKKLTRLKVEGRTRVQRAEIERYLADAGRAAAGAEDGPAQHDVDRMHERSDSL
jgi:excisionase family DNA binding protein